MRISEVRYNKRKDTNKWEYTVHVDGVRRRKSGFKTKNEAIAYVRSYLKSLERNVDSSITFTEYFSKWIKTNNKHKLSQSQSRNYYRAMELIDEFFGANVKLKDISKTDYQSFINWYGEGRAWETVRKVHTCLSPAFYDAVYEGYIQKSPTYKTELTHTVKPMSDEEKYLTIEEYETVIDYLKTRQAKSCLVLFIMAITGARNSEATEMSYDDLLSHDKAVFLNGTKNELGRRLVEISEENHNFIKERLSATPFATSGVPLRMTPDATVRMFKKALEACNIEKKRTPYSLRHTHVSYLISKGIPIEYISKRVGHKSVVTTLKIYAHLLEEHAHEQANKVRNLF